ncbi:hypothetical protein [Oceanobacillus manasiensis]|uniref:hypothetical protein n=1 Tax=Oceanobacillus manasiensis TaxID=586413 RepID=UPI0005AB7F0C|nr:hypothetical protein [Oceanobacillus manasiensis]
MKRLFSLTIFVMVLSLFSIQTIYADQSTNMFDFEKIEGETVRDSNELQKESSFLLDGLNIQQKEGIINGSGTIIQNGTKSELSIKGELYPVLGKGYYEGNLVLGDMDPTENYNVIQFKIEHKSEDSVSKNAESANATIVLEDKVTGEWIRFNQEIGKQTFEKFYQDSTLLIENKEVKELEVAEKVTNLLNIHNKAEHGEKIGNNIKVEDSGIDDTNGNRTVDEPISTQMDDISVNFRELDRMFQDLKDPYTDSVNLSDYNLPESLFKGSGWKKSANLNVNPGWGYYAAGSDQGSFTLTQITAFQFEGRFGEWVSGTNDYTNIWKIKHGMVLEYDHYTKDIKAFFYNLGINQRNFHLAQNLADGAGEVSVYTRQDLQGQGLTERSGSPLIKYVAGLIPYGDNVNNVWDTLSKMSPKNKDLGTAEEFVGKDFESQKEVHHGKVYRVVSGSLRDYDIRNEEAYVNLKGDIHSGDGSISLTWTYRTDLGTNLY